MQGSGSATVAWNSQCRSSTTASIRSLTSVRVRSSSGAPAWGEQRVEQPAELHVVRRIDLQRDQRPDLTDVDRVQFDENARGAEHLAYLGIAGDEHHLGAGAHSHVVDRHHRRDRAQHGEPLLGVGQHVGVDAPAVGLRCRFALGHLSPSIAGVVLAEF